jgi:V8-like Glu-specific endopeptidase
MKLSGEQYQQLLKALLDAFPSQARLEEFVQFRFGKNLNVIAMGGDLQEIIFKLIRTAQAGGWVDRLVSAARESQPGNSLLFAFSQEFNLAIPMPVGLTPEAIIRTTNSFLDVNIWRTKLGEIESQVCRIENTLGQKRGFGTGFLIAPDVVVTNYHVMEAVIAEKVSYTDVVLRFDYKKSADGTTLNQGAEYRLAQDWLIDQSIRSTQNKLYQLDELDYAILRVNGKPGNEKIGNNAEISAAKRGWIKLPTDPYEFQPDTPLFIVQHPKAEPLKLALDTNAIIEVDQNRTMVTYRTNTEGGSSGSPCFSADWVLVALHHSGDPDWWLPTYNAGTPFSAIYTLLDKRGCLKEILSN